MMNKSKTSTIKKILEIDAEIKQIKSNPSYIKIVNALKRVERKVGNAVMIIPSPDNLKKKLEIRRHSPEMKNVIRRYYERQYEYENKIKNLYDRKKNFEKKIFER